MKTNKKTLISKFDPFRFFGFTGFIALTTSVIIDTIYGIHNPYTIVPFVHIVTYIVNGFSILMTILIMINPSNKKIILAVVSVECVYTVLIGYELLGILLYGFLVLLLFAWGFFVHKFAKKVLISFSLWNIILLSLLPYGLQRFFFAFGVSLFNVSTYVCVYSVLFSKVSDFLPALQNSPEGNAPILPKSGSLLLFQNYPFTERQVMCIYLVMLGASSYKAIADKLSISISVIKKEMLEIFHFFGVKNREMLFILLSQYNLVFPDYIEKIKD